MASVQFSSVAQPCLMNPHESQHARPPCPSVNLKLGFPSSSDGKASACNAGNPSLIPGSGSSLGERIGYPLQYSWASLVAQTVENPEDLGSTLGWEDSPGERCGNPLSYSCLANAVDGGSWRATDIRIAKSDMTEPLTHRT